MTQVEHEAVRLTAFSHGAGCACKLSPADLRTVLGLVRGLGRRAADPDLLVGLDTADDAAVYRLRDDLAVVVTTDFFTPIVDDPYDWGRIAATNALSDVYAMGGAPLLALNLVAWPREGLPFELLARVLDGGGDVVRAAGALVGGGHSIDDAEPKFGLAVVGTVDPARVLTNRGARAGDALVLTKPIGLGVISTALKRDAAPPAARRRGDPRDDHAERRRARRRARARPTRCTRPPTSPASDCSGTSASCSSASGLAADVDVARGAGDRRRPRAARRRAWSRAARNATTRSSSDSVDWNGLARDEQLLLADAQTSGGLLLAVAPDAVDDLVARARRARHARRRRSSVGRAGAGARPGTHRDQGMTSIPSSASSCGRGLAPSDARSRRPLRNRPMSGMLCTSYCCASAGSSSMLTFTTL